MGRRAFSSRKAAWALAVAAALALLGWLIARGSGGVPDPTAGARLSHGAVIVDSGLLVFREGLETILVLAAVTASFRGADRALRAPVAGGGALALAATVGTWFAAAALIGAIGVGALDVQAATGVLAVVVLLVVMNWFFHRVYWTGWISNHHRRRRRMLDEAHAGHARRALLGLALLGFTSVYREGFEVVLFLQNLRLKYGAGVVLDGVAIGAALTLLVGVVTFRLQRRLPYKKMLVATGVLLGVVLVVMVGESAQELQLAGWLPSTHVPLAIPGWMGTWLALFPTAESLVAQVAAAALVIGSYVLAEEVRVRRPRRRAQRARVVAETAPPRPDASPV